MLFTIIIMEVPAIFDSSPENEIDYFPSLLPPRLRCAASASVSFSLSRATWPLTRRSVADWALWDANWPCNNISNRDTLPCKMWKSTLCTNYNDDLFSLTFLLPRKKNVTWARIFWVHRAKDDMQKALAMDASHCVVVHTHQECVDCPGTNK